MTTGDLRAFSLFFDADTGLVPGRSPTQRRLSAMKGMYADAVAFDAAVAAGDPLVYEFYELGLPAHPGDLAFGTSIVYPGKVGNEYFMTKGHFHAVVDTAEVYHCLRGQGRMVMQSPEGEPDVQTFTPGTAVYVPRRFAHRSVNVSAAEPLVTFFVFRADAGHDYGSIETRGMRKLVVEQNGKPITIDSPKWS